MCLNVMAELLSRSNQVQSTEWSLHPQVFKQICQKWFTPHMDLFATHLNHKLPLYVSPIPDPKAWDIDALNINWTGLSAYAYPPTALLHKVIQKNQTMQLSDHPNSPRLAQCITAEGCLTGNLTTLLPIFKDLKVVIKFLGCISSSSEP